MEKEIKQSEFLKKSLEEIEERKRVSRAVRKMIEMDKQEKLNTNVQPTK